nr:FAA hydrolase family protein [Dickeya zeae]MCA6988577.1 FAA hydrolase family protein [Dickeya zeae]
MKLASYRHQGKNSYGIHTPAGLIDLGSRLGDRYADLKALLAGQALHEAA